MTAKTVEMGPKLGSFKNPLASLSPYLSTRMTLSKHMDVGYEETEISVPLTSLVFRNLANSVMVLDDTYRLSPGQLCEVHSLNECLRPRTFNPILQSGIGHFV